MRAQQDPQSQDVTPKHALHHQVGDDGHGTEKRRHDQPNRLDDTEAEVESTRRGLPKTVVADSLREGADRPAAAGLRATNPAM